MHFMYPPIDDLLNDRMQYARYEVENVPVCDFLEKILVVVCVFQRAKYVAIRSDLCTFDKH